MKKVYDRIVDMRGNLITVIAKGVSLGELARIQKQNGRHTYASVLRIEGEKVTLQAFENTRGISTSDKISFLGREMVLYTWHVYILMSTQFVAAKEVQAGLEQSFTSTPHNVFEEALSTTLGRTGVTHTDPIIRRRSCSRRSICMNGCPRVDRWTPNGSRRGELAAQFATILSVNAGVLALPIPWVILLGVSKATAAPI